MIPHVWGPICWLVEPLDREAVDRLVTEHAKRLGFGDGCDWLDAEYIWNRASDGDQVALKSVPYIDRHLAHVGRARAAASASRRSKWESVRPMADEIIARIRERRPNLPRSSLAVLVLDELAGVCLKQPGRTTVQDWIKDFDG